MGNSNSQNQNGTVVNSDDESEQQQRQQSAGRCMHCGIAMIEKNAIWSWNGETARDHCTMQWICEECDQRLVKAYWIHMQATFEISRSSTENDLVKMSTKVALRQVWHPTGDTLNRRVKYNTCAHVLASSYSYSFFVPSGHNLVLFACCTSD